MSPLLLLFICVFIVMCSHTELSSSNSATAPEMTSKLLCELLCEHCNGVSNMERGQCICEVPASHFKENVACLERVQLSAAEMKLPLNHTAKIGVRRRRCATEDLDRVQPELAESLDSELAESLDSLRLKYSTMFPRVSLTKTSSSISDSRTDDPVTHRTKRSQQEVQEVSSPTSLQLLSDQILFEKSLEVVDKAGKNVIRRNIGQKEDPSNIMSVAKEKSDQSKLNLLSPQNCIPKCFEDSKLKNIESIKLSSLNFKNSLMNNLNSLLERNSPHKLKTEDSLNLSKGESKAQPDFFEVDSLDNIRSKSDPLLIDTKILSTSQHPLKLHDIIKRQKLKVSEANLSKRNKLNEIKMKFQKMFSKDNLRLSGLSQDNTDNYLPMEFEGVLFLGASPLQLNPSENDSKDDDIQTIDGFRSNKKPAGSILIDQIKENQLILDQILRKNKANLSLDQLARNIPGNTIPQIKTINTVLPSIRKPSNTFKGNTNRNEIDSVGTHVDTEDNLNTNQAAIVSLEHSKQGNINEPDNHGKQGPENFSNGKKTLENQGVNDERSSVENLWEDKSKTNEDSSKNLKFASPKSKLEYILRSTFPTKLSPPLIQVKPIKHVDERPVISPLHIERENTLISRDDPKVRVIGKNTLHTEKPIDKQVSSDERPSIENQIEEISKSSSSFKSFVDPSLKNKHSHLIRPVPMKEVGDGKIVSPPFTERENPQVSFDLQKMGLMDEHISNIPKLIKNQDEVDDRPNISNKWEEQKNENDIVNKSSDLQNMKSGLISHETLALETSSGTPLMYNKPIEQNADASATSPFADKEESLNPDRLASDIPNGTKIEGNIVNTESIERKTNDNSLAIGGESNDNTGTTLTETYKDDGVLLDKLGISSKPKSIDLYENNELPTELLRANDMQNGVTCLECFKHQPMKLETSPAANYVVQDIRGPSTFPLPSFPGQHVNSYAHIDQNYSPPGYGLLNAPSYFLNNMQQFDHARPFGQNEFLNSARHSFPLEQSPRLIQDNRGEVMNIPQADTFLLPPSSVFILKPVGHVPISHLLRQLSEGQAVVEIHQLPLHR